jgi:hypothetical protein
VVRAHRPKLVNLESPVLHSRAGLDVKERAGRLDSLRDPNDDRQDRKDKDHHRQ